MPLSSGSLAQNGSVKFIIGLVMAIGLTVTATAFAQSPATTLEQLEVELWPDYDRPAVLVLLTGTLPDDTALPATVTIPIPQSATINAVARIDTLGGMLSIVEIDDSVSGQLTFTVPDSRFRIEYYVPYTSDGDARDFTFEWRSDLAVDQLLPTIQQPSMATEMSVSPEALDVANRPDGLLYHSLPGIEVPAGQTYSLETSYTMTRPQLTAELLAEQQPAAPLFSEDLPESTVSTSDSDFNWPLVAIVVGVLLVIAAVVFLFISNRQKNKRVAKPRPVRRARSKQPTYSVGSEPAAGANFCHECGQGLDPSDRFCRNCGTVVKSR